jgi:hypothetical protein
LENNRQFQNQPPQIAHSNSHVSITHDTSTNSSNTNQPLITPSDDSTLLANNNYNQRQHKAQKLASRWRRLMTRRQQRRQQKQVNTDIMDRIIARNKLLESESPALMTEDKTPDNDSTASSSDTLLRPPPLSNSSISDDTSISSDDQTIDSGSTTSTDNCDALGPPPPGSLMDFWNKQFSPSEFSDFPQFFRDSIVSTDNDATPPDDDLSISSSDSVSTNLQRDPTLRHISYN